MRGMQVWTDLFPNCDDGALGFVGGKRSGLGNHESCRYVQASRRRA